MGIGVNLGGPDFLTHEGPFLDRMRLHGDPWHDTAKCDPISGLPTIAGDVTYQVPFDPVADGAYQDYAVLCSDTVVEIRTTWGWVKPVKGRAVIRKLRSSISAPVEVITSGPVDKLQIVRADQEARLAAGEVFNPAFLAAVKPFCGLRLLNPSATNFEPPTVAGVQTTSWPPRRPLLTDGYFSTERGGIAAELFGMLAKLTSKPLWYNIHHLMPTEQLIDVGKGVAAWGVPAKFELSNEIGYSFHRTWVFAAAAAHYKLAKASYFDVLRYYGWRAGQMGLILAQISPLFKVEIASQGSDGQSNLPYILKGWDESGAPRSLISGYANPGYLNLNDVEANDKFTAKYLDMVDRNDTEAFYLNVSSKVDGLVGRHAKAVKASAAEKLPFDVTEFNTSFYTQAPWVTDPIKRQRILDWAAPLLHSDRMADIVANCAQRTFGVGVRDVYAFELSGPASQYGAWGLLPHITQAPYPIYQRLAGMAKGPNLGAGIA